MSADNARPIYIAILGTDAFLAARPADPVQLTRACQLAGFDFVAPATWGEELIAAHLAGLIASTSDTCSAVAAICPLATDQVLATPMQTPVLRTVSPPVASARYIRAAFSPRPVHVTYVGGCPGAQHAEVDVHCHPDALFNRLAESGIDLSRQPRHLDGQLPMERARYASRPGGAPDTNWLVAHAGRRVVDAAPITADVVTQLHGNEAVLIDLAAACRCVCARDRTGAARMEPPRSSRPVIGEVPVSVAMADSSDSPQEIPEAAVTPYRIAEEEDGRARFAENGLSSGDTVPIPPAAHTLSRSKEPW